MTKPVVTEHMIEEAVYAYHHEDTIDLQGMRRAITAAIAAMPPIKLPKAKYKTSEEIEAQQYSDYWRGVCDGIDSAKAGIEAAGLRWVE